MAQHRKRACEGGAAVTTSWTTPAVSAGFDAYDDYVENRLAYTPLVNDLQTACGRGGIVLDYGCGSGKVSRRLLDAGAAAQVVGVDISTDMITLARAQTPQPAADSTPSTAATFPTRMTHSMRSCAASYSSTCPHARN